MDVLGVAAVAVGSILLIRWMSRSRFSEHTMGNARFIELTNVDELDEVFKSSNQQAKLLFLHDPWCPVSALATRQMIQLNREVVAIDVSRRHDLSREIERRTGVRHESPQAIVLDDGAAVWDASHTSIDRRSIELVMGTGSTEVTVGPTATGGESGA